MENHMILFVGTKINEKQKGYCYKSAASFEYAASDSQTIDIIEMSSGLLRNK